MIFKNKDSLPSKSATSTNPTMSIFGTKLALTSDPPTHRLTLRPQGIVSTGSQPLIGKCKGMLTPERLNIIRKAFHRAKCSGPHDHVKSPPISFASELIGLIARKDTSASKNMNKKIKDSLARILPSHITAAFQKWALATKGKNGIPP